TGLVTRPLATDTRSTQQCGGLFQSPPHAAEPTVRPDGLTTSGLRVPGAGQSRGQRLSGTTDDTIPVPTSRPTSPGSVRVRFWPVKYTVRPTITALSTASGRESRRSSAPVTASRITSVAPP